ncbi:hypothetical protein GE061_000187 [Apolygus lucorum]|uniref:Transposable element P transposase-like RNase H C-terminal domain-containing protein n=1 Tax=Apolygus lucorum TaxID=248454 RepID=A0A8S9Y3J6_APOLU|nr:hypothetical protein GE061_000187 [Apolygus lucorum]
MYTSIGRTGRLWLSSPQVIIRSVPMLFPLDDDLALFCPPKDVEVQKRDSSSESSAASGVTYAPSVEGYSSTQEWELKKKSADREMKMLRPQKRYCRAPNCDASSDSEKLFQSPPDPVRFSLQSLKFLPKSPTSPPCSTVTIQGWIRTVNAVQLLWTTLKEEIPFDKCSYLVPRRLNQDPLENLFGSIRSKCGSNVNPSAYQFTSALKTCLVNKLADDDLNKGNCEGDVQPQEILESLQRFLVPSANPEGREPVPASNSSLPTNYSDSFAVPRQVIVRQDCTGHRGISCAYVCGFSVSRLLGKHSCEQCRIGLVAASHQEYEALSLIEQREFSTATSGLSYPSRSIFVMFDHGLKLTHEVLERESYSCNIRQCIIALLSKELDFAWWQNHCPEHTNHIFEAITVSLCRIYIPWWCNCRNRAAKSARRELYSKKLMILQHQ